MVVHAGIGAIAQARGATAAVTIRRESDRRALLPLRESGIGRRDDGRDFMAGYARISDKWVPAAE